MPRMLTPKKVYTALKTVIDPELQIDIVSLGLIYDVLIDVGDEEGDETRIMITMTLTTPGCPLAPVIDDMVHQALFGLVDNVDHNVEVNLTFDPPWVTDMMSEEARLELGFD